MLWVALCSGQFSVICAGGRIALTQSAIAIMQGQVIIENDQCKVNRIQRVMRVRAIVRMNRVFSVSK